jgi:hypothetical protein
VVFFLPWWFRYHERVRGHARRSVALHRVDRVALDPAAMTVVALDLRQPSRMPGRRSVVPGFAWK